MKETIQSDTIKIGDTTFQVISIFSGSVDLRHLIQKLIRKEIEQMNNSY